MSHLCLRDALGEACAGAAELTGAGVASGAHVAPQEPWSSGTHVWVTAGDAGATPRAARSAHFAAHRRLAVHRRALLFHSSDPGYAALLRGLSSDSSLQSSAGWAIPIFGRGGRLLASIVLADADPSCFDDADLEGVSLLARAAGTAIDNAHRYTVARRDQERLFLARNTAGAAEGARLELESFNYSVAHDLRAPIRPIEGFSQALIEEYSEKLDATALDYLTRIRSAAQRMGELIDDLMRLSRTGFSEMILAPVDLAAVVRSIVAELRAREPSRSVTLVASSTAVVEGDRGLITIALENLLSNAWKFTKHAREPRIEFGTIVHDAETVFFVKDNGAGFDPAAAGRLFEPFRRLHSAAEFEGHGVGLAIVDRVVRRHGGRVWATAAPGRGASFQFTLGRDLVSGREEI